MSSSLLGLWKSEIINKGKYRRNKDWIKYFISTYLPRLVIVIIYDYYRNSAIITIQESKPEKGKEVLCHLEFEQLKILA